ncbi:DUF2330 domain-containing protein [Streptomyces sp. PKU-EA00015]|uniref:DUF2330 domain-containing protein n=1 Tax=Streptomyces sp. PKU-EA00015 TaxID=2748326 RepID=UPI0015A1F60B|nr:DUF2330 domain-containing protein [Streptomyces sp. PKU-EA00015]NWF27550.1 DUF2330 domain-containing protein [Streptomyces sp. PKU-EA00015]
MRGNIQERGPRPRALVVLLLLLGFQLGALVAPAHACGCGAMVPDRNASISVGRETSVVDWDGRTEQIVMRFTVTSDTPRAAWIMPVPGRATVDLADGALFDELVRIAAPEYRERHYFWPRGNDWPFDDVDGAGAAPPGAAARDDGVGVVGRERLGDFDVARLTATDPDALGDWLDENGFEMPAGLTGDLEPYVERGWEYVAVRLAPREEGAVLTGTLDPLRLRFASDELVYPMRLSRRADTAQALGLFVLADHRMEPRSAIGGSEPEVTYAGRVTSPGGELGRLTGGKERFLTVLDQEFPDPSRINGDHELRAAAEDTPFRRVVWDDDLLTLGGVPVWLLTFVAVAAGASAAVLRGVRARRRGRPVEPPAPMRVPPRVP